MLTLKFLKVATDLVILCNSFDERNHISTPIENLVKEAQKLAKMGLKN
jgi:hypothetical protein